MVHPTVAMQRQTLQKRFGRLMRAQRLALDMSQETLADESGLHRTYISLLERGHRNPSLHILWKLAQGLGVPPSKLVADLEPRRRTH